MPRSVLPAALSEQDVAVPLLDLHAMLSSMFSADAEPCRVPSSGQGSPVQWGARTVRLCPHGVPSA